MSSSQSRGGAGSNGWVEDGDVARLYHRLSGYGPEIDFPAAPADHTLVLQDFVANDAARWPPQYKRYDVGMRLPLPDGLET